MKDLYYTLPELYFVIFMISLVSLFSYLPVLIAGILSYVKQKAVTKGVIICFTIQLLCLLAWIDIAVCLKTQIIIIGTPFPIIIFYFTRFFLKKAKFTKDGFKGKN